MGPYDNETGRHLHSDGHENGHWYLHQNGALYIVPMDDAEIEGPDDDICDALGTEYRNTPFANINAETLAQKLDLDVVPDVLKRFDPAIGFYTA